MAVFNTIDVSTFQRTIDWDKVKAYGKIDFVMIRAGYGQNNIDEQFVRNITACNRLGIPCGVYWFSYATTVAEAKKEAEYCLAAVKPYRLELPIAYDFEDDSVKKAKAKGVTITKSLATAMCKEFCSTIEAAKYYCMVYTNGNYISKYYDSSILRAYDLWYAAWPGGYIDINKDKPSRSCGIWQYGYYQSSIPGFSCKDIDGNISYKNYPLIIKNANLNNLKTPEAEEAERKAIYESTMKININNLKNNKGETVVLQIANIIAKEKKENIEFKDYNKAIEYIRKLSNGDSLINNLYTLSK